MTRNTILELSAAALGILIVAAGATSIAVGGTHHVRPMRHPIMLPNSPVRPVVVAHTADVSTVSGLRAAAFNAAAQEGDATPTDVQAVQ